MISDAKHHQAGATIETRGVTLAAHFGDAAGEYAAARRSCGAFDRSDRGLIRAAGRDRAAWLHNLVTNDVRSLDEGCGAYAFALDVKGRIQFDLNVLHAGDALWLDVDALALASAMKHFDRYLITEDVKLSDERPAFARIGVSGPGAIAVAEALGAAGADTMPQLAHVVLAGDDARLVRHDFAGAPGFELIVPGASAGAWWDRLVESHACRPCGHWALDVLRIEAGIPWMGRDLDERVLPPETGQIERGISYHKGCYLGQEVVERMRSRGSLARRLVRLHVTRDAGDAAASYGSTPAGVKLPAALISDGVEVGRITSLVRRPTDGEWIGLGYLKTSAAESAALVVGEPRRAVHLLRS